MGATGATAAQQLSGCGDSTQAYGQPGDIQSDHAEDQASFIHMQLAVPEVQVAISSVLSMWLQLSSSSSSSSLLGERECDVTSSPVKDGFASGSSSSSSSNSNLNYKMGFIRHSYTVNKLCQCVILASSWESKSTPLSDLKFTPQPASSELASYVRLVCASMGVESHDVPTSEAQRQEQELQQSIDQHGLDNNEYLRPPLLKHLLRLKSQERKKKNKGEEGGQAVLFETALFRHCLCSKGIDMLTFPNLDRVTRLGDTGEGDNHSHSGLSESTGGVVGGAVARSPRLSLRLGAILAGHVLLRAAHQVASFANVAGAIRTSSVGTSTGGYEHRSAANGASASLPVDHSHAWHECDVENLQPVLRGLVSLVETHPGVLALHSLDALCAFARAAAAPLQRRTCTMPAYKNDGDWGTVSGALFDIDDTVNCTAFSSADASTAAAAAGSFTADGDDNGRAATSAKAITACSSYAKIALRGAMEAARKNIDFLFCR